MALIVKNIRLPLESDESDAFDAALKRLGISRSRVESIYTAKTSLDARHRGRVALVCSVGVELAQGEETLARKLSDALPPSEFSYREKAEYRLVPGTAKLCGRPVVAGFGPAGMFAGLVLARLGYRPLIVERGEDVDTRVKRVQGFWHGGTLDTESNVQFGEGGAGTFSDGKLTTRINDLRCETVLQELVAHGAPPEVLRLAKPHIGTDRLRGVVRAIREEIVRCGGEVRFGAKLEGLRVRSGRLEAVGVGGAWLPAGALILAVGHSARDTFQMLLDSGVMLVPKPFSAGVRIEHLQSEIDRGLYGPLAGHPRLPKGEYQLSYRSGGRAVYTFCMCPGGTVVAAASEAGGVVTNGMSLHARDGVNANAALVVAVSPEDFGHGPLDGVHFQRTLEQAAFTAGGSNYRAPVQTVGDFLQGGGQYREGPVAPSYPVGVTPCRLDRLLPGFISEMLTAGLQTFGRKLPGYAAPDAVLTGVETRTSSPVRIPRDENCEASGIRGLYPCGEGAGYAGGIVSASVDGLRCAEAVVAEFAPAG
jgi:uncharacterized FAD-dependent dehydrogenase